MPHTLGVIDRTRASLTVRAVPMVIMVRWAEGPLVVRLVHWAEGPLVVRLVRWAEGPWWSGWSAGLRVPGGQAGPLSLGSLVVRLVR